MTEAIPAQLLDVWERGVVEPPYVRALRLLCLALPDHTPDTLAGWGLGRRDDALLRVREAWFGETLNAVANCPACGTRLELNFRTADIRAPFAENELPPVQCEVQGERYDVRLRPLNTHDLMAAAVNPNREALMHRCIIEARQNGELFDQSLPPEVVAICVRALAECDPQSDVQLALTCPDCGHIWEALFDIAAYLWREVESWAQRTVREVHLLASRYGWTEGEILGLSAARRRLYLEMVTG